MSLSQEEKEIIYSHINKFRIENKAVPLVPMFQFELVAQTFADRHANGGDLHNKSLIPNYEKIDRYISCHNYTYIYSHIFNDDSPLLTWMTDTPHRTKLLSSYHYCGISRSKTNYRMNGYEWVFILGEMI
jgi:uncharacterized protein YkwD